MKGANWNQRENHRCPSLRGKKNLPKPMGAQILSRKLVRYTSKFNIDKPNSKQLLTPTSRGYNPSCPFLTPFRVVIKSYTYNILVGAHLVENFRNSSIPPPVLYQSIPKLHSHFLDARFLGWPLATAIFTLFLWGLGSDKPRGWFVNQKTKDHKNVFNLKFSESTI